MTSRIKGSTSTIFGTALLSAVFFVAGAAHASSQPESNAVVANAAQTKLSLNTAPASFRVAVSPGLSKSPVSGRLVVLLVRESEESKLPAGIEPIDGPFWDEAQPLFGIELRNLTPGEPAMLETDKIDWFLHSPLELPLGRYRAQARLHAHRDNSNWRRHDGNLYSGVVSFDLQADAGANVVVDMLLDRATKLDAPGEQAGLEYFSVRSKLLSDFRGHDVMLRAGVVLPLGYDPARSYAAVYEVPGFGGDHLGAARIASARANVGERSQPDADLARSTFWITLDPESPNGHTLFADSANNGPCGRALVQELIPALEAKYALKRQREARLLRGHSSGGWSTLWLATEYPSVFGACWSTSPDPVSFERFETLDIYHDANAFTTGADPIDAQRLSPQDPTLRSSFRKNGKSVMSVWQESRGEDIVGPDNTSGQQWDSWFAVFGPKNERGHPAALFDPTTGAIDRSVAEKYRSYDITDRLRRDPARFGPIFRDRVRLVVGDADNFYLNEGVALLKAALDEVAPATGKSVGSIEILPGLDHGSVFGSERVRGFPREMVEHLRTHGLVVSSEAGTTKPKE